MAAPLLLLGAALGSAAMYLFDPDKGRRRRALIKDRASKASNDMKDFVDKGKRDLAKRGTIVTGRVRSAFTRRKATDDVLAERVRSKMGRYVAHPGAIDVAAAGGTVTLTGSILSHEHDDLIEGISSVPAVRNIIDQLTVFEKAEGISELQGGRERAAEQPYVLQDSWAPGTRLRSGGGTEQDERWA